MPRAIVLFLFLLVTAAHGQIRPENAPPGFVPPVPKGIAGDGTRLNLRPIPLPSPDEAWIRVRTPRFTIVSGADENRTIDVARRLETLASALAAVHPRLERSSPRATHVFLFARRREAQPYFDLLLDQNDAQSSGVFVEQRDRGTMLVDISSARSERTPFHELIHYLLSGGENRPPLWIEEGLAEYFSNAELREESIVVGRRLPEHARLLARRKPIPLREFFAAGRTTEWTANPLFYAQAWVVVDWLMRRDRDAFYPFLSDLERGAPVENALQTHYDATFEDIERVVAAAPRSRGGMPATLRYQPAGSAFPIEPLAHADVLYEFGAFLAGIEEVAVEAERHLQAAIAARPGHGRAMAMLGVMRARDEKHAESEAFFARAVDASPHDGEIRLLFAEALLRNELGAFAETSELAPEDVPRFRRARRLAEEALRLGADPARSHGAIGTSYLVEDDFAKGVEALEKARTLAPSRHDYALHLLALYLRSEQREKADALFRQLEATSVVQIVFAARNVIVREELGRANALVKNQKLDEAAVAIRRLAAITPDFAARADLERQAAEIEKVAEINRHIAMYNRAISEVTKGNRRAALATLDELLKVAKDPAVIRDARTLRQKLR